MMRENWDDLRFILAVAEEGSVSGAARRLGVNHATVLRRVAAFEQASGMEVFDKRPHGYDVAADQSRIIEAAREVEQAVQAVKRMMQGARAPISGEVRVTATDTFCLCVMPEVLVRLRLATPDLKVEVICSNAHIDLARTKAEIAVRPAERLPDDLAGESPAWLGFAAFRARGRGGEDWLGMSGALSRSVASRWIAANVDPGRIVATADSFPALKQMAAAGLGRTILPAILCADDPRLESADDFEPVAVPIWVASHTDLAEISRIAEARRILCDALHAMAPRLLGPAQGAA